MWVTFKASFLCESRMKCTISLKQHGLLIPFFFMYVYLFSLMLASVYSQRHCKLFIVNRALGIFKP